MRFLYSDQGITVIISEFDIEFTAKSKEMALKIANAIYAQKGAALCRN